MIKITDLFIKEHHHELIKSYFSKFTGENIKLNFIYEQIISEHFIEYLADDLLLLIPISNFYRILMNYSKQTPIMSTGDEIKIIDFLFIYL